MKNLSFLLLFILAFTISCEQEEQVPANEVSLEKMIPSGQTRNIKFMGSSGTLEYIPNAGYCDPWGGGTLLLIKGSGKASRLGNFTVTNTVCLDGGGQPNSPFYGTLTAKNGDEINTQLVFGPYEVEGSTEMYYDYVVLGGTGRFDGIKGGDITMYGTVDYVNNVFSLKGEGTLEY